MNQAASRSNGWGRRWGLVAGLCALGLLAGMAPVQGQAPAAPAEKKQQPAKKGAETKPKLQRRDPFKSLLVRPEEMVGGQELPPGKAGLIIAQLLVRGIVVTPTDNIAVVTTAGRNRAYFLRERDELFNGYVERITGDSVVFKERATDPFGRVYEQEVVKQITGSGAKR